MIKGGILKITHINTYEIEECREKFEYNPDVLIIELEKITNNEIKFLKENNIFYRLNNDKTEIIILSFRTYLVEYSTKFREGIYFKKTKLYKNYYEECYYVDEMSDDEKNLIICKNGIKVEILTILDEETNQNDRKLFQEYFIDKIII